MVDADSLVALCGFSLGVVFEFPDLLVVRSSALELIFGFLLQG